MEPAVLYRHLHPNKRDSKDYRPYLALARDERDDVYASAYAAPEIRPVDSTLT